MRRTTQLLHSLFLALLVAVGAEIAWGTAAAMIYEAIPRRQIDLPTENAPVRTARGILLRNLFIQVQSDGTVVLYGGSYGAAVEHRLHSGAAAEHRLHGLDLKPITATRKERWIGAANLLGPLRPGERFVRPAWRERLIVIPEKKTYREAWYFVHDGRLDGSGYFVGYELRSKLALGYVGKNGYSTDVPPREECFEVDGRWLRHGHGMLRWREAGNSTLPGGDSHRQPSSVLPESVLFLASGGRIWKIDLARRAAGPITEDEGIVSFDVVRAPGAGELEAGEAMPEAVRLVARTPTKVMLLNLGGKREMTWPVPAELREADTPWNLISWYVLDDGRAIALSYQRQGDGPYWLQTQLARIDREGTITRKESFENYAVHEAGPGWSYAAFLLGPWMVLFLASEYWDPSSSIIDLPYLLAENWPALAVVFAGSAVLAWLAYRRQARFALPGAGVWAAFVFLFGLPGWLAYRWHRRWPVLETCGECRRPAPRDRESCASCGQAFAPPPLVGTEVFA
jgi:hypothetical protein